MKLIEDNVVWKAVKVYIFKFAVILSMGFVFIILSPWLAWKMYDGDWVFSISERVRKWMNGGEDA